VRLVPRVFRRSPDGAAPPAPTARARRRAAPPVRELRRERRALERLRDERIRDLGGLVLEMYRQDSFREHLLYEQCSEVAGIDERLAEVDVLLEARRPPAARCECGAPLFWGSRFCSHCGRPVAVEGEGAAARG
jgi:uncharacterized protein YjiS (DUF1127 family)